MKTDIEVVHSRFFGARLNLKRADGCCLTLDFENEACILDARGRVTEGLGIVTDAHEFLRLALEFSSEPAVVLRPESNLKCEVASKA